MDLLSSACRRLESNDGTLTLLNLSCMGVGSEGVVKLSKSCSSDHITRKPAQHQSDDGDQDLKVKTPLVALWLEGNEIYPSGARALRTLLPTSPRLKYLYLSNNHIGNAGAAALVPTAFQQLEVCNLSDNHVGSDGAAVIAGSLKMMHDDVEDGKNNNNCVVKSLILDNNVVGTQGAKAIAASLRHNKTLKHLDLRYNRIGVEGMRAFRDVLKDKGNTSLHYLLLEEQPFVLDDVGVDVGCTRHPPRRRNRKVSRVMEKRTCPCTACGIRYEIEYYLALNRAGRHSFHDTRIGASLWPLLLANKTEDEASLVYTILVERPDIALVR